MNENEARQAYLSVLKGWLGCVKGDSRHKAIVDTYNAGTSGYNVTYSDAWCAATVSAAAIKAGMAEIFPLECSCPRMIALAKSMGIWVENDAYTPKPGDLILYDWDDSGSGDNTGNPDHVGAVSTVSGALMTVIEGNKGGACGTRTMSVNGRYIRGYVTPKFAAWAAKQGGAASSTATATKAAVWYNPFKAYKNGSTPEPVYEDSDLEKQYGSLNAWESCYCIGRYGAAYAVLYKVDGYADRWKLGYVGYNGGVTD